MHTDHAEIRTGTLAADIIARHTARDGALLPVLHDIQTAFGHVPDRVIPMIAEALNLSRAEVHGVVTFYHDFRRAPPARPVVKLCHSEACQARGSAGIVAQVEADQRVVLEPVYCLGLCASGPAAMIGTQLFGRLDATSTARLLDEVAG